MKVTLAGKILVFVNLVLSLLFGGMALAVASHRVNWPGVKGGPPELAEGLIQEKKTEIGKWETTAQNGLTRYEEALTELVALEQDRPRKQKWYADQLAFLATGNGADGKPLKDAQVSRLVYKDGQLTMDAKGTLLGDPSKGYPFLEPLTTPLQQGLRPIPRMVKIQAEVDEDIKKAMARLDDAIKLEKKWTVEINGEESKEGKKEDKKGYRDLLAEVVAVEQNIQAELEYLRPLRYNSQVEAELLQKRQESLKARLRELEHSGVAVRDR